MGLFSRPRGSVVRRQDLYQRIKDRYEECVEFFGETSCSFLRFNGRYDDAIERGEDEVTFLEAELHAIESFLKKKQQQQAEEFQTPKASAFDTIANEFARRLDKYRPVSIAANAPREIECLAGALSDFSRGLYPPLEQALRKKREIGLADLRRTLEEEITALCEPRRGELPQAFLDYRYRIARLHDRDEIDKAGHQILKGAFRLFDAARKAVLYMEDHGHTGDRFIKPGGESLDFATYKSELISVLDLLLHDFRLKGLL